MNNKGTIILATFACLGKTTYAKKHPNIALDMESLPYKLKDLISENGDFEKIKNRETTFETNNENYPENYIADLKDKLGKYKVIFITLSPDIMEGLEKENIQYSIVYPNKSRKQKIIRDAEKRGNSSDFLRMLEEIIDTGKERAELRTLRKYEEFIIIDDNKYLDDLLATKFNILADSKINLSKYRVIAFDWDGTLVDSHREYFQMDKKIVKELFDKDDEVDFFANLWRRVEENHDNVDVDCRNKYYQIISLIFGDNKKTPEEIRRTALNYLSDTQKKIRYKASAEDFLLRLENKKTHKLALVTSSTRKDLDNFVKNSKSKELTKIFDLIVDRNAVRRHKPNPEPYLAVLDFFKCSPKEVLVFENSLVGCQSALSTGVDVVIVKDRYTNFDKLDESLDTIDSWADLAEEC
jgi:HAD superfamily hydrolase (TIGR01509 family)